MISLIEFEIKKFLNRKKNLLVISILVILAAIFITLNSSLDKNSSINTIASIESEIKSIEEALNKVESEIIRLPDNEKLKWINSDYEKELSLLRDMKNSYISNDYNKYLQSKIELDKKLLKNIEDENVIYSDDPNEIINDIELNTLLLENSIKPINTSVSMEGFNFIKLFLNSPISIILVILILILSSDVVSSEFDSNTYKLLFTQPISKNKIIISKIISTLIMVNVILFSVIAICFIILGAVNGFGDINYPIEFYNNGVIEYISIGKFILYELILFIILTAFMCILGVFISSLSKSTSNSVAVSIIITVSAYMISSQGFISKLEHLNPFIYFDISSVLQGKSANLFTNVNINFKYGVVTLMVSIIILLIPLIKKNNMKLTL